MRLVPLFFFFLLFLSATAFAKKHTVTGLSAITNSDIVSARQLAIVNAKYNAVDQVMGSYLRARTKVENFKFVKNQIESEIEGFIDSYHIVEEEVTKEHLYKVKLAVEFSEDDVWEPLSDINISNDDYSLPRILFTIEKEGDNHNASAAVVAHLTSLAKKSGFTVLNKKDSDKAGLEVKVSIASSSQQHIVAETQLQTNHLAIVASVIDLDGKSVLLSTIESGNDNNVNTAKAFKKLSKSVSGNLWKEFARELQQQWGSEQNRISDLFVIVKSAVEGDSIKWISEHLRNVSPGVNDVSLLELEGEQYYFSLRYRGWPEHYISELQEYQPGEGVNFNLTASQNSTISLELTN